MKATGIVRKIDDLGRIVIPKEIRRTMKIREGEPLEIFIERDGEVIFKKYSQIGDITSGAESVAHSLHKAGGFPVVVFDRDGAVAAGGLSKKEFSEIKVGEEIDGFMEKRSSYYRRSSEKKITLVPEKELSVSAFSPIVSNGDIIGGVASLSDKEEPNDCEKKLVEAGALFLGKENEE